MQNVTVIALSLGGLLAAGSANSQDVVALAPPAVDNRPEGRAIGVGVALGAGSMSVGNDSRTKFATGIVARLGLDSRNRFQLIGEYYPTRIQSPVLTESFSSANVLLSFSFGRKLKIRPVVGAQFRWWTGGQRVTDSDSGPVIGLDLGPELRLGDKVSISPELVLRLSLIEVEGDVTSRHIGAQVVVSWRGGS